MDLGVDGGDKKKKKRGRPKKNKKIDVKKHADIVSDMIQHAIQGAEVNEQVVDDGDDSGDNSGQVIHVVEFALNNDDNNKYLKDQHDIIYDMHTNQPIGVYLPESKEIHFHKT